MSISIFEPKGMNGNLKPTMKREGYFPPMIYEHFKDEGLVEMER